MEVLLQNQSGQVFDITSLVVQASLQDHINKSCALSLDILADTDAFPSEGCRIRFSIDGSVWFLGIVFKAAKDESQVYKITAYDQLRYLTANDTYVFDNETASDAVRRICNDLQLTVGSLADTQYLISGKVCDDQAMLDMISDCIQLTAIHTNQLYYLKDIAGAVSLRNIKDSITDLVIDPEYLLSKYSYERSIDDDSYNLVKLVQDDADTGKRMQYVVKDSTNIRAWGGILQYYEKIDDSLNAGQMKERAKSLLTLKNRVTQTLTLTAEGDDRIRAGNVIYINIPDVSVKRFLLCTSAVHSFSGASHTVKADFKLV